MVHHRKALIARLIGLGLKARVLVINTESAAETALYERIGRSCSPEAVPMGEAT